MSAELVTFSDEVQNIETNQTYFSVTAVKKAFIDPQTEANTLVSLKYALAPIEKENAFWVCLIMHVCLAACPCQIVNVWFARPSMICKALHIDMFHWLYTFMPVLIMYTKFQGHSSIQKVKLPVAFLGVTSCLKKFKLCIFGTYIGKIRYRKYVWLWCVIEIIDVLFDIADILTMAFLHGLWAVSTVITSLSLTPLHQFWCIRSNLKVTVASKQWSVNEGCVFLMSSHWISVTL